MNTQIKNYGVTLSNLSEADVKCLSYTTSSVDIWLCSVINSQIEFAKIGIINALKEHCFNNNIQPAETEDAKILQAFELGLVKTAQQVMDEQVALMAAEQARLAAEQAANAPHTI